MNTSKKKITRSSQNWLLSPVVTTFLATKAFLSMDISDAASAGQHDPPAGAEHL
ncbi:MAG: hypothetical protein WBH77_05495 [Saccharofermentanales bacterium]